MKITAVRASYKNSTYKIHKTLGVLLEYDLLKGNNDQLPERNQKSFNQVLDPYKLDIATKSTSIKSFSNKSSFAKYLARLFTFLSLRSFVFVRIISYLRFPIFESTEEAILFYRKTFPGEQQSLCLPRSLFAACTSKSFKSSGSLFIGVFLPSRAMHAWIIENDVQPDPFDDIWICYQPVAIMYSK